MTALVSVIIPVYNQENYLAECLDSVLGQSLNDIEIICIDDGCTDRSAEILQKYVQQDKRIIVLQQENNGAAFARNYGIREAHGDFIAFLDSDDSYPGKTTLQCLHSAAITNGVDICGGSIATLKDYDKKIEKKFAGDKSDFTFHEEKKCLYSDYQFDYGFTRFLYNRNLLSKNKIEFPPYRIFEDPPFFVKAMIAAKEFYAIPDIVYLYRNSHKINQYDAQKAIDFTKGVIENLETAKQHDLHSLYKITLRRCMGFAKRFSSVQSLDFLFLLLTLYSKLDRNEEFTEVNSEFCNLLNEYFYAEGSIYKAVIKNLQAEIGNIKKSKSYRLGNSLLSPFKLVKVFFQNFSN